MPAGPIDDVDEIPHEAIVEEAVIKIAGYPCGKQSQRDVSDFTVGSCEQKHRNHDHQRHDRDSNEQPTLSRGYAEGRSGIYGQMQLQKTFYYRETIPPLTPKPAKYGVLGPQIKNQDCCKDGPEEKVRGNGRQRTEDRGRRICLRLCVNCHQFCVPC